MQGPSNSRPTSRAARGESRAKHLWNGLALLVASGCGVTPAFEARWSLDRGARADFAGELPVPLADAEQCSRAGLRHLELLTYDTSTEARTLVSLQGAPCFPGGFEDPETTFGGPALADGDYVVVLRGVQNHPQRSPWVTTVPLPPECAGAGLDDPSRCQPCNAEATACLPGFDVCTCRSVTVRAADEAPIVDFVLSAPPECSDGIDNDGDGRTDADDESCEVARTCPPGTATCLPSESTAVERNTLVLEVRWLGVPESEVPQGTCTHLDVSTVTVSLARDGEIVWEGSVPCDARSLEDRVFTLDLPPATYAVGVVTYGGDGEERTVPRSLELSLLPGPNPLPLEIWGEEFVEPLVGAATLALCEGTDPVITHARVEVLGPRGLAAEVVDAEGRPLDGSILPCTSIVTEPLTFGLFAVEATLMAGDVECFGTGSSKPRLWPGAVTPILAPEVLGGEGCPACLYDVHCGPAEVCIASQCQPR